jgi:hypothetical protein
MMCAVRAPCARARRDTETHEARRRVDHVDHVVERPRQLVDILAINGVTNVRWRRWRIPWIGNRMCSISFSSSALS